MLEELGISNEYQELLFTNLKTVNFFPVLLSPKSNEKPGSVNNRWKVAVNVKLESDL